jgi:hypothetical protein
MTIAVLLAACTSNRSPESHQAETPIELHTDDVVSPFDRRLLGTNVPAWLLPELVRDPVFRDQLVASGTTLLRLPGGSWSNGYDWLDCELGDPDRCQWTWAMRPSDFVDLLQTTRLPAMWTVSINGTAEEAAAAVAFFNGDVDDERPIGTDRNGRDWQTVGHWAQLRSEHGHPEPAHISYWEVGNEVFAAVPDAGPGCVSWGWEHVWTCDGTEYVDGTEDHDGFVRFRQAMRDVDASIEVGAVGVGDRGAWNDWDDEVMDAAGDTIDFYIVHHYGSNGDVEPDDVMEIPGRDWPRITRAIRDGAADHALADLPIAVTEHNLVAFLDGDDERLMTTALNAFYLAETIGQMSLNGVAIANQWNLANGRAENGSDYGLIEAQTHERSPAYYAMVLWSRFGDALVQTDKDDGVIDDGLLLYGGRGPDGSARLLVVNPSSGPVSSTISVQPAPGPNAVVTADEFVAESMLSTAVTFNGSTSPSVDLTEPGRVLPLRQDGVLEHSFPPYSITLLRWGAQS